MHIAIAFDQLLWYLFVLLILLQVADAYTTIRALKQSGNREGNPAMAWLFNKIGVKTTQIFTKVTFIVLAYYYMGWQAMAVLDAFYMWVVVNNWKLIKNG